VSAEPLVALDAVRRSFGRGATAVAAVRSATLRVMPGEVVAIMGPSGGGKSTLLCLMAGLLLPDAGRVVVAGRSLVELSAAARAELRRGQVGFVFQKFNLLRSLTARENVELALELAGRRSATRERAAEALAAVGLARCADRKPRDLSGGEQQRVAVARALAAGPRLVLADEPTGNLDSANGRATVELLRAHARGEGAAVVVVTHDPRVSECVDRRLWMEDGELGEADLA
jgi:putative ABC transport system ATP-binding protein